MLFDSYCKNIDLSHNKFSAEQLKHFVKSECLNENNSMLSFDVRFNPGANEKVLKTISLQLLKNVSHIQNQG